ncbi:BAM_G0008490.mRNA.1.CDS.1 [Saccharomyces cerevisiae]|nr:BAM_G0008490.mRNA.1.CDS.1 [Saccharomyces cerevisiae]CAI7065184.1 BAM_G0008490.mRNA.1.CDS.1 [Saccharomyces cerevisiae]
MYKIKIIQFFTIDHFIQNYIPLENFGPDWCRCFNFIRDPGLQIFCGDSIQRSNIWRCDDPQDVFNYNIFMHDPSVFYNIANLVLPPENIYSPLHSFIKMLQMKGKLLRNYTQNIDNLESYAGISTDKLVQCHGSFATATCVTCHWNPRVEDI